MTDLAAIDDALGELGAVPSDVAELIDRYGPEDRSVEGVDEALSALAEGVEPAQVPVRPGAVSAGSPGPPSLQDTVVDGDSPAPSVPTSTDAVDAELDAFLADEGADERALSDHPEQAPEQASATPPPVGGTEDEDAWADEAPTSTSSIPVQGQLEAYDGMVAPPTELQAEASEPPPKRNSSIKELLRQDLDPGDFPQTSHPPPPPAGSPEAAAVAAADDSMPADDEDDFELLVDDSDIIEIDDEELELIDD